MTVPIMALGGKGTISVLSNLLPVEVNKMCKMCIEGEILAAGQLQLDLIPIIRAIFKESNPIPIKYAMHRLGFCELSYRLPLCEPSLETKGLIDLILENL